MSDEPIKLEDQVKIGRALQRIARMVDRELRKATGGKQVLFSVYTWSGHRAQYVSNANREDIKAGMQETLDRWNEPDDGPEFHGRGVQ